MGLHTTIKEHSQCTDQTDCVQISEKEPLIRHIYLIKPTYSLAAFEFEYLNLISLGAATRDTTNNVPGLPNFHGDHVCRLGVCRRNVTPGIS